MSDNWNWATHRFLQEHRDYIYFWVWEGDCSNEIEEFVKQFEIDPAYKGHKEYLIDKMVGEYLIDKMNELYWADTKMDSFQEHIWNVYLKQLQMREIGHYVLDVLSEFKEEQAA